MEQLAAPHTHCPTVNCLCGPLVHPEVSSDLYIQGHAFVWPHYLLVFVSVVCTAHTCSVCTCTTCVHISVPSKVCARRWEHS